MTVKTTKSEMPKLKGTGLDRVQRMRSATASIGNAVEEICNGGNEDMPGFMVYGFALVLEWCSENLAEIEKEMLAGSGKGTRDEN